MIILNVVDRDGTTHRIEAESGNTVMEALQDQPWGVEAICGGMCSCATCHIYVDPAFQTFLPPMSADEDELLEATLDRRDNSRLSCQIPCGEDLDGMMVTIAPSMM